MKLIQLHWQFKDKPNEFIAQVDMEEFESHNDFREWVRRVTKEHPAPIGSQILACEESSEHFIKTNEDRNARKHRI